MSRFLAKVFVKYERLKEKHLDNDRLPVNRSEGSGPPTTFVLPNFPKLPSSFPLQNLSVPSWVFITALLLSLHGVHLTLSSSTRTSLTCTTERDYCTYTAMNYDGGGRLGDLRRLQYERKLARDPTAKDTKGLSVHFLKEDLLSSSQVRLSRYRTGKEPKEPVNYPDDDVVATVSSLTRIEKRRLGYGYEITVNVHVPAEEMYSNLASSIDGAVNVVPVSAYVLDVRELRDVRDLRDAGRTLSQARSVTLPMTFKSTGRKTSKTKAGIINAWVTALGGSDGEGGTDEGLRIKEATGYSFRGVVEVVIGMIVCIGCTVWWLIDDGDGYGYDVDSRKAK